jgi:N-acetylglutamate synthase-like GNAT family acetyltransferase
MELRPMTTADVSQLEEIDGTVESSHYLHVDRTGEAIAVSWKLEERPLRQTLIEPARLTDEAKFLIKQITSGIEEGTTLVAEHEGRIIAVLLAQQRPENKTMVLHDLRVDFDFRRQGIGLALIFQLIQQTRDMGLRAVAAESKTNNIPAAKLLAKCGFDLAGVDTHRETNHDLVKEAVTLLWYVAMD